jgi:hypothetical protein
MITDQEAPSSLGLTPLLTGIVQDAQTLLRQQLSLFQSEVKNDLGRTKDAAIPLGMGVAVASVALIFLCLAAVYGLVWAWPTLPLFAAFAIVGGVLGLIGGVLIYTGKSKFDAFSPLPEKSVEGLKENLQWTTKT